jgi:glucose/arabinose dehydrogenase
MRERTLLLTLLAALVLAGPARADTTQSGDLSLSSIGNFTEPTYLTSAPGDNSRLFVAQQGGDVVVLRVGFRGTFLSVPHVHDAGEQGLLSLAFAPDYASSGRFYVAYSDSAACDGGGSNCDLRVDEFRRGADADHADPASQRRVIEINHRQNQNHNGGQLEFGPDGRLWLGVGDGGGAGDQPGNAQNDGTLLGKLLRLDLSGGPPEVWAKGLRNPWRFSFDALTGDLLLADVGQDRREEVDFRPAGSPAGANFGWNVCEGDITYPGANPCPPNPVPDYVAPILAYATGSNGTCAVTGGYVVRDLRLPQLGGRYVYGDYCGQTLRSLVPASAPGSDAPLGDASSPLKVSSLSSFGQDGLCRLYAVSRSGPVYRLDPAAATAVAGCTASPDRTAPSLTRVAMLRRLFAVARRATSLVARGAARRGTAFRYTLSEPARVTIAIDRLAPGRRVGSRCLAATRARRQRPRCTRALRRGTLVRTGVAAGRHSTPFSGRLGRRSLAVGRYRATLRATDAAGNVSRAARIRFRIARP